MAPTRVGLVGLSSMTQTIPATPGGGWAAIAHLPYLLQSSDYEITALLNSSVAAAQAAIKLHNLSPDIKAYGTPEDLAQDPEIDLVVCCVRVDRHYALTIPSIRAGKSIFVEWPLASNRAQAEEMLAAAKESGSKTIVGLQGRVAPYTRKIKHLIESKAIGDLISSNFNQAVCMPGDMEAPGVDYMAKKAVGGNMHTIIFGHAADAALWALGGIDDFAAVVSTRWPDVKLLRTDYSFDKMIKRETPDHVMLQGTLKGSGAPFQMSVRLGMPFKNMPSVDWRILGKKGEIRITSFAPIGLGDGSEKIDVFEYEKATIDIIEVEGNDVVPGSSAVANNVGRIYEMFLEGGTAEEGFVDFEQALRFHDFLEKMEKSSELKTFEKVV